MVDKRYPQVPGSDVETPPDSRSQQPPQQPQAPTPPKPLYPGGDAAYPGGPAAYPSIPPAGVGSGGSGPFTQPPYTSSPYDQSPQQGPFPQPGEQQPPVMGIPVMGDRVSYIYMHPVWGEDDYTRDNRFACCAWVTFLIGFVFPIFWLISVLLPCCMPGIHVRRAATASLIAAIVWAVAAVILAPLLTTTSG